MNTEDIDPRYVEFDLWNSADALAALLDDQAVAVASVRAAAPALASAVDAASERLRAGGRLIYAGAGTSARIAVQDGAELAPTFNWPRERVAFAIAGGESALLQAIENAEDDGKSGVKRMHELGVSAGDVVIGVAASGETPFTVGALREAMARGALTIGFANAPHSALLRTCDVPVLLDTGSEVIAGSTRMKAGTAQKIALNLLSTMIMVRLGRVYGALMVDMRPTNEKLRRRAERMVMTIAECDAGAARSALAEADGDVKLAALIASGVAFAQARALLHKHDGNLRAALGEARQAQ